MIGNDVKLWGFITLRSVDFVSYIPQNVLHISLSKFCTDTCALLSLILPFVDVDHVSMYDCCIKNSNVTYFSELISKIIGRFFNCSTLTILLMRWRDSGVHLKHRPVYCCTHPILTFLLNFHNIGNVTWFKFIVVDICWNVYHVRKKRNIALFYLEESSHWYAIPKRKVHAEKTMILLTTLNIFYSVCIQITC